MQIIHELCCDEHKIHQNYQIHLPCKYKNVNSLHMPAALGIIIVHLLAYNFFISLDMWTNRWKTGLKNNLTDQRCSFWTSWFKIAPSLSNSPVASFILCAANVKRSTAGQTLMLERGQGLSNFKLLPHHYSNNYLSFLTHIKLCVALYHLILSAMVIKVMSKDWNLWPILFLKVIITHWYSPMKSDVPSKRRKVDINTSLTLN